MGRRDELYNDTRADIVFFQAVRLYELRFMIPAVSLHELRVEFFRQ